AKGLGGDWTSEEFVHIARVQRWLEDFQAAYANRVLFCDTDAFTTSLFHEVYLGRESPPELARLAAAGRYDLYVVCDLDIPFAQDDWGTRDDGPPRRLMQDRYLDHVRASGRRYVVVSGTVEQRLEQASAEVERLWGRGS